MIELSEYEQQFLENRTAFYWKERFKIELVKAEGLQRLQQDTNEKLKILHEQQQHLLRILGERDGG